MKVEPSAVQVSSPVPTWFFNARTHTNDDVWQSLPTFPAFHG